MQTIWHAAWIHASCSVRRLVHDDYWSQGPCSEVTCHLVLKSLQLLVIFKKFSILIILHIAQIDVSKTWFHQSSYLRTTYVPSCLSVQVCAKEISILPKSPSFVLWTVTSLTPQHKHAYAPGHLTSFFISYCAHTSFNDHFLFILHRQASLFFCRLRCFSKMLTAFFSTGHWLGIILL